MKLFNYNKKAFTLIELIMSIVIAGIIFLSISGAYQQITASLASNTRYCKAVDLTRLENSIVQNMSYTDATLTPPYDVTTSNYQGSGYSLRRVVAYEAGDGASAQSLKRITITVSIGGTTILSTQTFRAKNVYYGP